MSLAVLPAELRPSAQEIVRLPDGREVMLGKARPEFRRSSWPTGFNTFGGKPALEWNGEPCFAEIVILRLFERAGWEGRWVETYGAAAMEPRLFLDWSPAGLKATPTRAAPERPESILRSIGERNGRTLAGCFDVIAWKEGRVVFAEAKRAGRDRIQRTQIRWLAAALDVGVEVEDLLIVEWSAP